MENFGLNGQSDSNYDNFLCFSKKCKARKAAKRKIRSQKKAVKRNSPTAIMKQLGTVGVVPSKPSFFIRASPSPTVLPQVSSVPSVQPTKASLASNPMVIVGALLVVGAFVYTGFKAGKPVATVQSTNPNKLV